MKLMGIIKRVDENQSEIVSLLRRLGASVWITSALGKGAPDLVLGMAGLNLLVELKRDSKTKLTPHEQKFHDEWRGQICVVRSEQDAINLINRVRNEFTTSIS